MNHHSVALSRTQKQKPAKTSSKAMGGKARTERQAEVQAQALTNAVAGASMANYQAIFEGFAAMGIDPADVQPRENVFTFHAWKALGRVVKKGQHGVRIVTVIPCTKKDETTGEEVPVKKPKATTVFHISQTEPLDTEDTDHAPDGARPALPAPIAPADPAPAPPAPAAAEAPAVEAKDEEEDEARPLNYYEARIEARRARLEARAATASQESERAYKKARQMAEAIPFGQPILVGHHSEKRDRNYRDRIHNTFGKAFGEMEKAEHYASKAAAVGTGGISSDDPEALDKLRAELADMEAAQERMKEANKVIRAHKTPDAQVAALVARGSTQSMASEAVKPDFMGRVGFPGYALSNNNANMRRVRQRITELEARRQKSDVERQGTGFVYREDVEENRVMFIFDGKPDAPTRELLKKHGFRWSPNRDGKPWVRQLNNAGIWNGGEVFKALNSAKIGDDNTPR